MVDVVKCCVDESAQCPEENRWERGCIRGGGISRSRHELVKVLRLDPSHPYTAALRRGPCAEAHAGCAENVSSLAPDGKFLYCLRHH